ncbi:MAG: PAS domain S-box protein [Nitrosomonadales bacterium]|nr:PAS domain S-box protein [Nitrosomonadales bacterium]
MDKPVEPQQGESKPDLQAEIVRLNKVVQALMNRVERNTSIQSSDFNLFQTAITLEEEVRRRTGELEAALRENEKITRALRESENHNRLLVENSPMCIHEIGMDGRITSMNRSGLIMMGLKDECEIQGYRYLDAVSDADRERIGALMDKAYGGESSHFEFQAAGTAEQIYKSCFVPIKDKHGHIEKLMGITEDITGRKRLERQLTEREALFRTIFEQADFAIELIDPDTLQFVEVNPAVCRMLGYTREELLRMNLVDTQADLDRAALLDSVRQNEAEGGASFANRHRCRNGDILDVEINAHILHIGGKRLLVALWRDVTGQKRAQEEIRFKNTILQTQQETSPDAILVVDENGRIVSYNRQFVELWQLPPQLIEAGEDEPVLKSVVDQVANPQAFFARVQYLYQHRDEKSREEIPLGDGRVIERYSAPATGADGRYYGRVWYFRDITARKRAEENLVAREREFRTLAENSPGNIARYDCEGHTLYANPTLEHTLGIRAADMVGKTPTEFVPRALFDAYQKALLHVGATGESVSFEQIVPAGEGRPQIHSIHMVPELGPYGIPVGVLAVGHDISEIKWAEENLHITASVFENSQEGIVITDADNRFVDVNPAFTRITGYTREEAMGKDPSLLKSGRQDEAYYRSMWKSLQENKAWRGEIWNRRKSGEIYPEMLSITAICDDKEKVQRYVGVFSDISYIKAHESELSRIAHYDALTGVPNRLLLADRLTQAMSASERSGRHGAVMFLDLDNFKPLNDGHGHEVGDLLLIEVAQRITRCVRGMDTVARFGGDEFVVLLGELDVGREVSIAQARAVAEKIRAALEEPYYLRRKYCVLPNPENSGDGTTSGPRSSAEGQDDNAEHAVEHRCTASIGVVLFVDHEASLENVLKWADIAMYRAKENGRNTVCVFEKQG